MCIEYKGQLYHLTEKSMFFDDKPAISTHFKEKTDDTFCEVSDYYVKELKPNDADVQNIYDVCFYVIYHDTSETVRKRASELKEYVEKGDCHISDGEFDEIYRHRWCVNENHAYHYADIENNEVSIVTIGASSEDWVNVDCGLCSKTVSVFDCEKLLVEYTYSVRDGKKLTKKEVVEVTMDPEDFKAEMLEYRIGNI